MEKTSQSWQSPSLGREIVLSVYGNEGTPLLALPSAGGDRSEWEERGLIDSLSYQIENGHNLIFCVDSVDNETFFNTEISPRVRINRHRHYESYIIDEVLPFIHKTTNNPFVMAAGVDMGGYHALNLLLKHPGQIHKVIAIGGRFQIRPFMDDFFDRNVYFNNPLEYLPNLEDKELLEQIRNSDIRLVVTPDDLNLDLNYMMSDILRSKAIEHIFDYWLETGDNKWGIRGDILQRHVP